MGISGARRATVYKASDPEDYIELRLISQDGEYEKRDIIERDLDGNPIVIEEDAILVLAFYDDADMDKLKAWKSAGEKMNVVVIGLQDYIFWDRDSSFSTQESALFAPRRRNSRRIVFRAQGEDLEIQKRIEIQLWDGESKLTGFVGGDQDDDGIEAIPIVPASVGSDSSFTWTIDGQAYQMDTVILNTRN